MNTISFNQLVVQMKLNNSIGAGVSNLIDMGHTVENIELSYINSGIMGVLEGTTLIVDIMGVTKELMIDVDPLDVGLMLSQSAVLGINTLKAN